MKKKMAEPRIFHLPSIYPYSMILLLVAHILPSTDWTSFCLFCSYSFFFIAHLFSGSMFDNYTHKCKCCKNDAKMLATLEKWDIAPTVSKDEWWVNSDKGAVLRAVDDTGWHNICDLTDDAFFTWWCWFSLITISHNAHIGTHSTGGGYHRQRGRRGGYSRGRIRQEGGRWGEGMEVRDLDKLGDEKRAVVWGI